MFSHFARLALVQLVVATWMYRSSSSAQLAIPDAKRLASLQSHGGQTKTAAIDMILQLQASGALEGNATERELRRDLAYEAESHAKTMTPYGTVVQTIDLGAPKLKHWEICHPFAWLWYLTHISTHFRDIMQSCIVGGRPLNLVIYADELVPGNPYRPEKSRTLMCIYWAFVEWPSWMLSRTFAWPCFSILRSKIIEDIPGRMTYLARVILRVFFPESGESMTTGILIESSSGPMLIKAQFAGWLADLVGHKEITEWKGHGGNVCCLGCDNLDSRITGVRSSGAIGLDCADCTKFDRRTPAKFNAIIDDLIEKKLTLGKTKFKVLQTEVGINYIPTGILFDETMRAIYRPVDHFIVDWQHTMCQDGVANTCIGMTLNLIKDQGFTLPHVRSFMMLCTMPSKYQHGKPVEGWLHKNRLKETTLGSFSSIVLNLLPIIWLFLEKYCTENAALVAVVRCFKLMYHICGILASGADAAPKYAARLRRMMKEFHELAVLLSFPLMPKIHHMHHIIDGMVWLGKLLSCFVTERKHRTIKDSALHVFRHIEHTVLADVINKQCHQVVEGTDLFNETFLVDARELSNGMLRSNKAVLAVGSMKANDIVWLKDARCGSVLMFYQVQDVIVISVNIFSDFMGDPAKFDERQAMQTFIDPRAILDVCTWFYDDELIIKVAIPPLFLVAM